MKRIVVVGAGLGGVPIRRLGIVVGDSLLGVPLTELQEAHG